MTKYSTPSIVLGILLISVLFVWYNNIKSADQLLIKTIATCPTYYEEVAKLNNQQYKIIHTNSTAESIALLHNNQVDMVLAGRILKPWEPTSTAITIGEGYSFISKQEQTIYIDELKNYKIYTDLDPIVIKQVFPIENIEQNNDIYQYLDKGIVITSWKNTDYAKANSIYLIEKNNQRVKLSRQPTIYCHQNCQPDAQILSLIINN